MTDQNTKQEQVVSFINEMHDLFSKHAVVMQAADARLAELDTEGFKLLYAKLPQNDLIEIVQAQHIKTNELYGEYRKLNETLRTIMQDISGCKDFLAFDDLKKKARAILLAQDMVDRGKDPKEVRKMLEKETSGLSTSNIIVQ